MTKKDMTHIIGLVAGGIAYVGYPWLPSWFTATVIILLFPLVIRSLWLALREMRNG